MTETITVGKLRKALEGFPDDAFVIASRDDIGQWAQRVAGTSPAIIDADVKLRDQMITTRSRRTNKTNALLLYVGF